MLGLGAATRIYVATGATDMRLSFDGLYSLVIGQIWQSPQSGQTQREFCRQHQMPVTSFSSLLRRHAGQNSSAQSMPTTAPAGPGAAALLPVEIIEERALLPVTKPSSLIIEIPGGFRITVDPDFDAHMLRRLVAALGRDE